MAMDQHQQLILAVVVIHFNKKLVESSLNCVLFFFKDYMSCLSFSNKSMKSSSSKSISSSLLMVTNILLISTLSNPLKSFRNFGHPKRKKLFHLFKDFSSFLIIKVFFIPGASDLILCQNLILIVNNRQYSCPTIPKDWTINITFPPFSWCFIIVSLSSSVIT